jgi:hypothetical protein
MMTRKSDVRVYAHVRDRSVEWLTHIFGTAGRVHKVDLEANLCIRTGRAQGACVSNLRGQAMSRRYFVGVSHGKHLREETKCTLWVPMSLSEVRVVP